MEKPEPAAMTDEALLEHAKILKKMKIYDAVIIGFLIGIAIYASVKNGFGLLTFLPLVYIPIAKRNNDKRSEVEKILKERNLK